MMTEKIIQQIEQEMEETKNRLISEIKKIDKTEKDDIKKQRRELYNKTLEESNKRTTLNFKAQDEILLVISSALFGLITFLSEKSQGNSWLTWLIVSNAISLVSALLSYYCGNKDIKKGLEYAKKYYLEEKECFFNKKSCWSFIAKALYTLSLFSLVIAIIILTILLGFA